jgi:hypothetical protein
MNIGKFEIVFRDNNSEAGSLFMTNLAYDAIPMLKTSRAKWCGCLEWVANATSCV